MKSDHRDHLEDTLSLSGPLRIQVLVQIQFSFRSGPSHDVFWLPVQVGLDGSDELRLLLQRQVQVVLLVAGDVPQHLVDELVVL